jgi:hypothetical protein
MMWLTWRQFRAQARVALAALAVVAVLLIVTGLHIAHVYNASGIPACRGAGDCEHLAASYLSALRASASLSFLYQAVSVVLYAVPALIGAFWGAPVITRELEAGTLRLAWSQSVTRTRWLAVKLGAVGLAAMATAGLLSLMVTWWAAPVTRATALPGRDRPCVPRSRRSCSARGTSPPWATPPSPSSSVSRPGCCCAGPWPPSPPAWPSSPAPRPSWRW